MNIGFLHGPRPRYFARCRRSNSLMRRLCLPIVSTIRLYFPNATGPATMHATGLHTTYISKQGDMTVQPAITEATTSQSWYWISSVDVVAPAAAAAIVTFGDSITDGARSTPDANHNW